VVAVSYVVDRMLAEFAAASVVFARAAEFSFDEEGKVTFAKFLASIEGAREDSSPGVLPFFQHRAEAHHKDFLWSGPDVQILPRSKAVLSTIQVAAAGELLDLPVCPIYVVDLDEDSSAFPSPVGKRLHPPGSLDISDKQPKKRRF